MGGQIDPKSRKSGAGGTPKGRQEAKMKKRGVVSNSAALLGAIFEENGLQDGGQNREKINKKSDSKSYYFLVNFLTSCRNDLLGKIERKSIPK